MIVKSFTSKVFLASAITSLFFATAASIASLFSPSTWFLRTASSARTLVTSASDVTWSKTFLASVIGVAVFAVSAFLASSAFFASSAFLALASDSVKTAVKSAILAASASTSA